MPLTWKNITAPNNNGANRLGNLGANRINQGLSALSNLAFKQSDEIQDGIKKKGADATDALLNDIFSIGSVSEYDEAIQSGKFDLNSLDKGVDATKIRNALESRDNELFKDESDRAAYSAQVSKRKDAPLLNDYMTQLTQARTKDEVTSIQQGLSALGLTDTGMLTGAKATNERLTQLQSTADANTARYRSNVAFANQQENQNYTLEQRAANDYKPEEQLKYNSEISSLNSQLQALESKYKKPDNVGEIMAVGSGVDALYAWSTKYTDSEGTRLNLPTLDNTLNESLGSNEYIVDGESRTWQQLPRYVMEQALKGSFPTNNWELTDTGLIDLDDDEVKKINNGILGALDTYNAEVKRQNTKKVETTAIAEKLLKSRIELVELKNKGIEAYRASKNPRRNM